MHWRIEMAQRRPDVSVIIPVYNVEQYLKRCVDSVLCQSLTNLEIILVDDGSPDRSPVICDQYLAEDERVQVIHKQNGGLASARNAGLKIATGKYIFFLDSDDWIDPDGLQLLYETAEKYQVDFVRFRAIRSNWPGLPENAPGMLGEERELPGGYYDRSKIIELVYPKLLATPKLTMGAIVGVWESLYSTEFLKQNALFFFEEVKFSEDQIFSAHVVKAANSFYYIDTACVYHYWYNPKSISRSFREGRWESCKQTIRLSEAGFGDDNCYDFSEQLNALRWFNILLALNEKKYLETSKERIKYCRSILSDPNLKMRQLSLKNLDISAKQRILLVLIKLKMAVIVAKL